MEMPAPASVVAVCVSKNKGERKTPVESVDLKVSHGISGDAHAGDWHRQVSLLASESIEKMQKMGLDVDAGDFAENITTRGIGLFTLPVGTLLAVGTTLLRVTQIGKECHTRCAIYHQAGDCVMPKEGIFAEVLKGGTVRAGDGVAVLKAKNELKALSFVAKSGTGKTTLLEKVIAELKSRGYRVGAIKHDAHRFEIDKPGKDSYRLTAAGADATLITSPEKLALIKRPEASPPLEELIQRYLDDMDLVLTEGFKKSGLPKIEVHRQDRSAGLLCRGEESDPSLVAVASDGALSLDVPVLDLNNPSFVADFVEGYFQLGTKGKA
ncbi:MAG: molybdopterin-guanine dinucleotide biosynthesis protein B [Desulfuromonadales bacterium]